MASAAINYRVHAFLCVLLGSVIGLLRVTILWLALSASYSYFALAIPLFLPDLALFPTIDQWTIWNKLTISTALLLLTIFWTFCVYAMILLIVEAIRRLT